MGLDGEVRGVYMGIYTINDILKYTQKTSLWGQVFVKLRGYPIKSTQKGTKNRALWVNSGESPVDNS